LNPGAKLKLIKHIFALAGLASVTLAYSVDLTYATANYGYKKGEYLVVRDGTAPNERFSIASHGDGELGNDNFHVYLMAEPAHTKIARLDDIGPDNTLDTAPDAYHAAWSPDSRHVSVSFRSDRHFVETNLYKIRNRRAYLIDGPTLFTAATNRQTRLLGDDMRAKVTEITWSSPTRFTLKEHRVFMTTTPNFARALGGYGKQVDKYKADTKYYVEFSAEADCELVSGRGYRVVKLKPGRFEE
jgi:hypothetical protein